MNKRDTTIRPVVYCSECCGEIFGAPAIVRGFPYHQRCLDRSVYESRYDAEEDYESHYEIGGEA